MEAQDAEAVRLWAGLEEVRAGRAFKCTQGDGSGEGRNDQLWEGSGVRSWVSASEGG